MIALRISVSSTTDSYLSSNFAYKINTYLLCEDKTIVYNWEQLQEVIDEINEQVRVELPVSYRSQIKINVRKVEI